MRLTALRFSLVILTVSMLAACNSLQSRFDQTVAVSPEMLRSTVRFQKEYLLVEGDQVEVVVWRSPEVSRTVTVRPDGNISLPLVQELRAAGLSPRELAVQVRAALSVRLINPEVNILPMTVRQPMVYVLGDARSPGGFPLRNASTAAQAIALAGGTLRSANEDKISIIRLSADGHLEATRLTGATMMSGPSPFMTMAATQLKADDIVFVPESGRSEVTRTVNDLLAPFTLYLNFKLLEKAY